MFYVPQTVIFNGGVQLRSTTNYTSNSVYLFNGQTIFFSLPVTLFALTNDCKIIISNFVPCTAALAAEKRWFILFILAYKELINFIRTCKRIHLQTWTKGFKVWNNQFRLFHIFRSISKDISATQFTIKIMYQ